MERFLRIRWILGELKSPSSSLDAVLPDIDLREILTSQSIIPRLLRCYLMEKLDSEFAAVFTENR